MRCLLVLAALLVAVPVHAFDIIPITVNYTDDLAPAISGSNVVWQGCDGGTGPSPWDCTGGDWEIYLWDGSTITQITNNSADDQHPDVSGSNVVWDSDGEIYFWGGSFPIVPIRISDPTTVDRNPAISGSNVVWQSWVLGNTNWEITFWDGSFPIVPFQITDDPADSEYPDVSGSNVVWLSPYEDDYGIFLWDGSTISLISDNTTDVDGPAISGSNVVWVGCDGGTGQSWDCTGGDYEVYLWDGSTTTNISDNSTWEQYPDISGSNVVWESDDEIYFWDGSTITQITDSYYDDDRNPAISGWNVAWRTCDVEDCWDDGDYEIYMTTLPIPACGDGLDNDGDGLIDYPNDRGCTDASDSSEREWTLICDDGVDNDGDTLIDYPDDPGCYNSLWVSENPQCMDGIDNDGDTLIDYPDDPACASAFWFTEASQCQDGINNDPGEDDLIDFDGGESIHGACSTGICPPGVSDPDGDGVADPDPECVGRPAGLRESTCGLGVELAMVLAALMWLHRRRRSHH